MGATVFMEEEIVTLHYDVEKAVDFAFQGKFILDFYQYLPYKSTINKNKTSKQTLEAFNTHEYVVSQSADSAGNS